MPPGNMLGCPIALMASSHLSNAIPRFCRFAAGRGVPAPQGRRRQHEMAAPVLPSLSRNPPCEALCKDYILRLN